MKKWGKRGENNGFTEFFFILPKTNLNDAHCPYAKFHSDFSKNEDRSPKCIQIGQRYPPL